MDWNVIGTDALTKLTPVIVLVLVYYARTFLSTAPPLVVNLITVFLTGVVQVVDTLISGGTYSPLMTAVLFAFATTLHNLLSNSGVSPYVKRALFIKS